MLPLLVAADAGGVFTLTDRTEARMRAPDPITNAVALDLETVADARVVWTKPGVSYTLADSPRFTWLDYNGAARQAAVSDNLVAFAQWQSSSARFRVAESASYGQLSFESLSTLPPPTQPSQTTPSGQPTMPSGPPTPSPTATLVAPTSQAILFASSETSATTNLRLRSWNVFARVAYELSGGANSAAQQILPFQQGPVGQLGADWRLTPQGRDHLITLVNGSEATFSTGTRDVLLGIEEQWRHQWARRTETLLDVGLTAERTSGGPDAAADGSGSSAVGGAAFVQRFRRGRESGEIRCEFRVAPSTNALTGLIAEAGFATVSGSWIHGRLNARGLASAGESLEQSTPTAFRLATAEIDVAYSPSKVVAFDGGIRGLYQQQNGLNGASTGGGQAPIVQSTIAQAVVFLGVTIRPVKVRF